MLPHFLNWFEFWLETNVDILDIDLQVVDNILDDFAEVALFLHSLHFEFLFQSFSESLSEFDKSGVSVIHQIVLQVLPGFWD